MFDLDLATFRRRTMEREPVDAASFDPARDPYASRGGRVDEGWMASWARRAHGRAGTKAGRHAHSARAFHAQPVRAPALLLYFLLLFRFLITLVPPFRRRQSFAAAARTPGARRPTPDTSRRLPRCLSNSGVC